MAVVGEGIREILLWVHLTLEDVVVGVGTLALQRLPLVLVEFVPDGVVFAVCCTLRDVQQPAQRQVWGYAQESQTARHRQSQTWLHEE